MVMEFLRKASHLLPDKFYIALKFKKNVGDWPNIKNPKTFNEKMQWLKLNDKNPDYIKMVDKHEAKKYVASIIGEEYIIPEYGVWDRFEDIDFDSLPEQFVLKTTHDCAGVVICRDKKSFDKEKAKKFLNMHLKKNYFYEGREWPYKNIKPRIIAEKYLENFQNEGLRDYKFYCYHGEPKLLYVSQGLENHETARISFLTLDWQFANFKRGDYASLESLPEKPECFEEMIEKAKVLSEDIPFIRVDLYEVDGQVYFSELTLYPTSGFMKVSPKESDEELGKYLILKH